VHLEGAKEMKQEPYAWEFCGALFHDKDEVFGWWEEMQRTDEQITENPPLPLYTEPQEYQRPHNTVLVPCDKLKAMQDYIKHLESALESSLNLSKVLVERQPRELTDDEIITRYRELMARSSV
jgi:hypothetical protein